MVFTLMKIAFPWELTKSISLKEPYQTRRTAQTSRYPSEPAHIFKSNQSEGAYVARYYDVTRGWILKHVGSEVHARAVADKALRDTGWYLC